MFTPKGAGTALITPFNTDFSVDFTAITHIINHLIANNTDYVVVLGTTAEVATLSATEKKDIVNHVINIVDNRVPIVLGMGGNNTLHLCTEILNTDFTGISALLSISPYYNKPNQAGIYEHYKMVSEASKVPVIIYNVPGRTGSNISAETQLKLANLPNIIGTKEASGDVEQVMTILKNKPANFFVISGEDSLTFPLLACGAVGVISVINHAFTLKFNTMVHEANKGNWSTALENHYATLNGCRAIFEDGNPGGIKVMLNEMGLCKNVVRPPLHVVNTNLEAKLRDLIVEYKKLS